MRARVLVTALIIATALAVAGCGSEDGGTSAGDTSARDKAAGSADAGGETEPGADGVPRTLRFTGTTVDGKPFDGATLAGKPTVLWFWAPWCAVCRSQAPQTAKLADEYEGKANVVGVAGLDKNGPMRDFISSTKVGGFPHLDDAEGGIWRRFGITQQSHYVLLDKNGTSVYSGVPSGPEELGKRIAELVG